ncbi:hypothetical protein SAMN04487785_10334 [Dyella jiangningensis]|uniref:hypothetical protein n=1 Tax=Dyella sp. AtDHG13 TaxID=1938897 RepID=UPI00088F1E6A|nr:hypothetical protein [Dyella sp. AtDHG13]PXV61803.1 hypothetical protein BDW41_101549 [Dyella sp. AtDHG13]SDJ63338.1 hypothetical protein SAMN04487785_10334 [Dyella jiangningensis]
MSHVTPALYATLAEIVPELHVHCLEPWCVIGSAAALLAGADVGVADVDLLTSREDAERLMALWSDRREHVYEPAGAERFRSHFARFRFPGLPVEVMGGLELNQGDGWKPVRAGRLTLAGLNGLAVPVPSVEDQIRILESFGREKDVRRASVLRALASSPLRGED